MKTIAKPFLISCTVLFFIFFVLQAGFAEEYADRVGQEFHTVVDFYTNIKGIEYVYCGFYLILFPIFYTYLFKK